MFVTNFLATNDLHLKLMFSRYNSDNRNFSERFFFSVLLFFVLLFFCFVFMISLSLSEPTYF